MENRVGFWPRVAASVIDFVLVGVLAVMLRGMVGALIPGVVERKIAEAISTPGAEAAKGALTSMVTWGLAAGLLAPIYGLMEAFLGYSPGKLILGLRIVGENGQPAPHTTLLVRFLVKSSAGLIGIAAMFVATQTLELVSQIASVALIVGFFLVLTKSRQAVHDKIAGTAVLRKSDVAVSDVAAGQPA